MHRLLSDLDQDKADTNYEWKLFVYLKLVTSLFFVLLLQIKDCLDHTALPMDGTTLTEALHQRGINVRYLGSVLEFVEKMPAKPQLDHFYVRNKALNSHIMCLLLLDAVLDPFLPHYRE